MSNNNWTSKLSLTNRLLYEDIKDFLPKHVTGITFDSRLVQPGNIFVCLQGTQFNGNDYIDEAIDKGAILIVSDDATQLNTEPLASNSIHNVPVIYQENTRSALSFLSDAFYHLKTDYKSDYLYTIGITGTDGKSSTAYIIYGALRELGMNAALISTLGIFIDGKEIINENRKTRLTTPDPPELFQLIHQAKQCNSDVIILEITSHALKFDKVSAVELDCAIFTSFSPDHQEFHESEDDYFNAKAKIINLMRKYDSQASSQFRPQKTGNLILNADNKKIADLSNAFNDNALLVHNASMVGFHQDATVKITKTEEQLFQTKYQINVFLSAQTKLMGDFNLMNIGMAYEAISIYSSEVHRSFSSEEILQAIETCSNIPGRLEQIDGAPFNVIVDYAHTPDAFEKISNTLAKYIKGKLIVVFGCAGERSKDRRYGLGRLAAEKANMSILTEEDSRSESIHDIVQDIENQMKESGAIEGDNYKIILDRKEAIEFALQYATEDDFVLILGKGHEKSIESGGEIIPWDDREITKKLIKELF
jgi:UDP-N-acetylmuramyl-tripeptide synthetase